MITHLGTRFRLPSSWLLGVLAPLGALAPLLLAGCATTRVADRSQPSSVDSVDVGYGRVGEDQVVGSVSTIDADEVRVEHPKTLAHMLSEIPGVQVTELPGGEMRVRVRGANSFLAGEDPLWVVDGMVVQSAGGLFGIDPNTIESISVLKDAGSTAIYGSRGANGVILIKTKRGSG